MRHRIWNTSFEKLLTHSSTDEFTEKKSQIITRIIIEDQRVLCNGSSCTHIIYCKFFNHSPNLIIKSSEVKDLKITPTKSYSIQIYKGTNGEITFEKSNMFQKRQNKNHTRYNIKLNKDGKVFVAKNLSEDLYDLFLSRITNGEIVDTIEDLVILFSGMN